MSSIYKYELPTSAQKGQTMPSIIVSHQVFRLGLPFQVNHLSCSEARVLYGGCVSIVPLVLDNLLKVYSVIKENSKELQETWPPQTQRPRSIQSARHQRSKTESKCLDVCKYMFLVVC